MIDRAVLNRQEREELKRLLTKIKDRKWPEHEECVEEFLATQLLGAIEDDQ